MNLIATLNQVVQDLDNADVPAAIDPRDLNPPCVWVAPRSVNRFNLCGGHELSVDLVLISPDVGAISALPILAEMLDKVLGAFPGAGEVSMNETVTMSGSAPLPAFRVPIEITTS